MADPTLQSSLNQTPTHSTESDRVISTGLGREAEQDFESHANKIWAELDQKDAEKDGGPAPEPPSAPVSDPPPDQDPEAHKPIEVKPAEEKPRKSKRPDTRAPAFPEDEPKPVAAKSESRPEAGSEAEIDSFEPHPSASESQKSQFSQLKTAAKKFASEAKTFRAKIAPLAQELGVELGDDIGTGLDGLAEKVKSLKTATIDPQAQLEIDYYRARDAAKGLLDSVTFQREFRFPLDRKFDDVVETIYRHLPGDPGKNKADWLDPLINQFRPGSKNAQSLSEDWWRQQIDAMQTDGLTKQTVWNKLVEMRGLQETHDQKAAEISTNPVSLEKLRELDAQEYRQIYESSVREETDIAIKEAEYAEILELRTRALNGSDSDRKHFEKLENQFKEAMLALNSGPRSACRVAMSLVAAKDKLAKYEDLVAENKELKKEVRKKRGISDSVLNPRSGLGGAGKAQPERTKIGGKIDWSNL